jgi:arginine N-succinyltransferase
MLHVRAAGPADLPAMMELARLSGAGFTSLPEDEATLAARLDLSRRSFAGAIAPGEAWYTLMLVDAATDRVEGVAGVRAAVGLRRPHFSFRVVTLAQYSPAIDTRFDHRALVLVNECSGWTEVGSLFLRPERRSGGTGKMLARSRYMLLGADPLRFGETVMAELRGWFEPDGSSPFWDGVASKFFRLPFEEADRLVTASDGQFILDLAPRHPIYVELIEERACHAIGRVHRDGEPALAMLRAEGFGHSGLVDVFDGGPTVTARRDAIRTVAGGRTRLVELGEVGGEASTLLSTAAVDGFRATQAAALVAGERIVIDPVTADLLHLRGGDPVRADR